MGVSIQRTGGSRRAGGCWEAAAGQVWPLALPWAAACWLPAPPYQSQYQNTRAELSHKTQGEVKPGSLLLTIERKEDHAMLARPRKAILCCGARENVMRFAAGQNSVPVAAVCGKAVVSLVIEALRSRPSSAPINRKKAQV